MTRLTKGSLQARLEGGVAVQNGIHGSSISGFGTVIASFSDPSKQTPSLHGPAAQNNEHGGRYSIASMVSGLG
jgi:hypothetical protein